MPEWATLGAVFDEPRLSLNGDEPLYGDDVGTQSMVATALGVPKSDLAHKRIQQSAF
jgi:hypothetical protein